MSPLDQALIYCRDFGWWVLPCRWEGDRRKQPLVEGGFHNASNNPERIFAWWRRWPDALIGVATGASRLTVLDVDCKDGKWGPDTLADLGHSIPDTWMSHTASGGWHCVFFADPDDGCDIPSTNNKLGPGLDVRGNTGYFIAPSLGSGYSWDPLNNPDTLPLAPAPAWLIPPAPPVETQTRAKPVRPAVGLSRYADAAIERACQAIRHATDGHQHTTLRNEAYSIGRLAGAGGIPPYSLKTRSSTRVMGCRITD